MSSVKRSLGGHNYIHGNWVYGGGMVFNTTFKRYFSYIVAVSFIGAGNQYTQRKPQTCHKSLTNIITNVVSSTPRLSGIQTHNVSGDRH